MSPYHGYPDHYYNMTKSGLHNLFKNHFHVQRQDVLDSGHPIHSITWILRNWSEGLSSAVKDQFLDIKVGELIGDPNSYFDESYVNQLTLEKKFELGATTALWGSKKQIDKKINKLFFIFFILSFCYKFGADYSRFTNSRKTQGNAR